MSDSRVSLTLTITSSRFTIISGIFYCLWLTSKSEVEEVSALAEFETITSCYCEYSTFYSKHEIRLTQSDLKRMFRLNIFEIYRARLAVTWIQNKLKETPSPGARWATLFDLLNNCLRKTLICDE